MRSLTKPGGVLARNPSMGMKDLGMELCIEGVFCAARYAAVSDSAAEKGANRRGISCFCAMVQDEAR